MAPHDDTLKKLNPLPETRKLGEQYIRQAKLKTGPGSGRNLASLDVAIPAICMRLATEKLNNGDITESAAKGACCLKPSDYKKAYNLIKLAIEEAEKPELTYDELHEIYNTESRAALMQNSFNKVEKELLLLEKGLDERMAIFTATVFFWVDTVPETFTFAKENDLPVKRFVELLEILNDNCARLRNTIEKELKAKLSFPTKKPTTTTKTTSTPRQSPRKSTNISTEDSDQSALKRHSLRNNTQLGTVLTPPTKRVNQLSPTKIVQPSPFRGLLGKKAAMRELPSKDSPKKRPAQEQLKDDSMNIDSTAFPESPSKKRKVESQLKTIARPSVAKTSNVRNLAAELEKLVSPSKGKAQSASSPSVLRSTSRMQVAAVESDSSSDESEPEINLSMRRFRPVYLDFKQWNTRDPRLDRIWKKAGKQCRALANSGRPGE